MLTSADSSQDSKIDVDKLNSFFLKAYIQYKVVSLLDQKTLNDLNQRMMIDLLNAPLTIYPYLNQMDSNSSNYYPVSNYRANIIPSNLNNNFEQHMAKNNLSSKAFEANKGYDDSKAINNREVKKNKEKKVTNCSHTNQRHYAKGYCYKCYYKYGNPKRATKCPHTTSPHYACGLCKSCYQQLRFKEVAK